MTRNINSQASFPGSDKFPLERATIQMYYCLLSSSVKSHVASMRSTNATWKACSKGFKQENNNYKPHVQYGLTIIFINRTRTHLFVRVLVFLSFNMSSRTCKQVFIITCDQYFYLNFYNCTWFLKFLFRLFFLSISIYLHIFCVHLPTGIVGKCYSYSSILLQFLNYFF